MAPRDRSLRFDRLFIAAATLAPLVAALRTMRRGRIDAVAVEPAELRAAA